jgi:pSer/pThr/pTyr-binding forkhead associated (FHA) protein
LGGKNGTTLNGQRLAGPMAAADGARIAMRSVVLIVRMFDEPAATVTGLR